jgi:GNAT superfamily N-acetyltransferase
VEGKVDGAEPRLRLAKQSDRDSIDVLMKASTRALFPQFYTAEQTASSVIHIAHVDPMLIEDRTYFVIEAAGEVVACGGWSKRDKLFSGSAEQEGRARLLDPATEAARIRAMFVRGDWTRRGLGTQILEACESAARIARSASDRLTGVALGQPGEGVQFALEAPAVRAGGEDPRHDRRDQAVRPEFLNDLGAVTLDLEGRAVLPAEN